MANPRIRSLVSGGGQGSEGTEVAIVAQKKNLRAKVRDENKLKEGEYQKELQGPARTSV